MLSVSSPLYDILKTFEENFSHPAFPIIRAIRSWPSKEQWTFLFQFPLASRIGVAACAATTGKGIALLAKLGFDILTYKTIRSKATPTHPLPNIAHVDVDKLLEYSDLEQIISVKDKPSRSDKIAISNSFGNGCLEPDVVMQDISFAKKNLSEGQVLIVSIYGEGDSTKLVAKDFAKAAIMAKDSGADILELNFSCPNLLNSRDALFCDTERVYQIISYVVTCVGEIPLLIKLGLLYQDPTKLLVAAARAGARGVSAINSIRMRVINRMQFPAFGRRTYSGVSGYPIRKLAIQSIKKLVQINQKEKLNLAIIGMGGITLPEHFNEFFNEGADIALTASGMMWNPLLASQFHQL